MAIRIYVANLAKYTEGKLVGKWIDLPCLDLDKKIEEILGDDEEYTIHDSECDLDGLEIEECSNLHELNEMAEKIEGLHNNDLLRISYLLDDHGMEFEDALAYYEDVTVYEHMTLIEVAEELVDSGCFGDIQDSLRNYIDYEAIARDLSHDSYFEKNGNVFYYV